MKIKIPLMVFLLSILFALPCCADVIEEKTSPFGSGYILSGYFPVEFIYPNGDKEYYVAEAWAQNVHDGKGALDPVYLSDRAKYFLKEFGYRYDGYSGKYDIFTKPVRIGFMVDHPNEGGYGTGARDDNVANPLSMTSQQVEQYVNNHIWLFDALAGSPLPPDPHAPKGYLSILDFGQPDLEVKDVISGVANNMAVKGQTYHAKAVFFNNYPIDAKVKSLGLYHRVGGVLYPIKEVELQHLSSWTGVNVEGDWTADGSPGEALVAKVNATIDKIPAAPGEILLSQVPGGPMTTTQERDWENNQKVLNVDARQNLRVEIIDYPSKVIEGDTATVSARIFNGSGQMIVTKVVWKVDGKVVKEVGNFDLISHADSVLPFTVSNHNATVEVEVNPDQDRPANEVTYSDNSASCTVISIPKKVEASGNLSIQAPNPVCAKHVAKWNDNYEDVGYDIAEDWNFTVKVITDIPKPSTGPNSPPPPLPVVVVNVGGQSVWASGGYHHEGYNLYGPIVNNNVIDVSYSKKTSYTASWGHCEKTITFTFPKSGLYGYDKTVNLSATADCKNYGIHLLASKNVTLKGLFVKDFGVKQTL